MGKKIISLLLIVAIAAGAYAALLRGFDADTFRGGAPAGPGLAAAGGGKLIEVFVTDWCPYCKSLEGELKSRNVSYRRYNLEADQVAEDRFRDLGGTGVPLVLVGGKRFSGDVEQIIAASK